MEGERQREGRREGNETGKGERARGAGRCAWPGGVHVLVLAKNVSGKSGRGP